MNIFPIFQTILYTISTALLYPVIILLICLSIWMIIYAGGFFTEFVKRKKNKSFPFLIDSLEYIRQNKTIPKNIKKMLPLHIAGYSEDLGNIILNKSPLIDERVEELNQRTETSLFSEVDKIQLIVKIGPALGLMGTLIPMGTGLAGLSAGNMAQLSSSLILAFTSTVVGIALGTCAHFFAVIKERWFTEDMRIINLLTDVMVKDREDKPGFVVEKIKLPATG